MTIVVRVSVGVFLLAGMFMPVGVSQAQLSLSYERPLILIIKPEYPAPGENVRLRVQSYSIDLTRSDVVWRADGVIFAQGAGLVESSFNAGPPGDSTLIEVFATDIEGATATANARLVPTLIDIVWDSDSYVPPFYKGRSFAGTNATIRAYAFTDFTDGAGNPLPENAIVYTWSRNSTVLLDQSGRGKSRIMVAGPGLFGTDTISVVAETLDKTRSARAVVQIPASDTILALYENHPLFGVLYHRAIVGDVNTGEREQKVTAVPFFARVTSPSDDSLIYAWNVNEMSVAPDTEEPETITIAANDYSGPVDISLNITNAADYLMNASGVWRIIFGENAGLFFGTGPSNPFGQ